MLEFVKELVWSGLMIAGFIWLAMMSLLGSINYWLSRLVAKAERLKELAPTED